MKGWRTIALNVALAGAAVFDYLSASQGLIERAVDNPKHAALVVLAVSVVNILLRLVTTGPVGKADK